MENKNNNIFLGKIEKSGCYINNGKYGYFLTCGKKNYKIPEWLEPEEITLDMAKRLIEYKQKISEEWLEKKNKESKNDQPHSGDMPSGREIVKEEEIKPKVEPKPIKKKRIIKKVIYQGASSSDSDDADEVEVVKNNISEPGCSKFV